MSSPPPSPVKRKAPVKRETSSTKLLGMTDTELKALCYASICTSEKIKVDYDKLAAMLNITRKSASNQYTAARNKLEKAIQKDAGNDSADLTDDLASPTKKPKVAKPKAPRTPKKPRKTIKSEAEVKDETEAETEAGTESVAKGLKIEESEFPDPLNLLYDENDNYMA